MIKVGLTGGIASGKSTVSNMLRQFGIPIIDADQIAREVVEPGQPAYSKIIDAFGESILQEDRTLNRKKLGDLIFNNQDHRFLLNSIVHPMVRERMLNQVSDYLKAKERAVILDIPLLIESRLLSLVDKVLLVYVNEDVQQKRLMKRDHLTDEQAFSRINSQLPLNEKRDYADEIIDNNGSIEMTQEQLKKILTEWQIA